MKNIRIEIVLTLMVVLTGLKCTAQDSNRTLLRQVIRENQEAVDAIAMYPTETRKIIFEAAEYPEVIAKLNEMQKASEDSFAKLISSLSKDEQEKIWNLTRYDGLLSDLASGHKKSADEIKTILVNYPEEIHKTALEEGTDRYDLIVQIDNMNEGYNSDFEVLMSDYPSAVMNTFREMIKMPEVLDILFDHMQYTVVIGDFYKRNPERVIHKTDSLNLVLTQKSAQEAGDWKQSMSDNPQAQEEYTEAAQEYARDNGYRPEDYNAPLTQDVTNYNSNPYNWWFGYPSWYPYDYWNPYPYWYDWGFYYGPGGRVVFFGLPSAYFMDWFFYYPEHCYKYAELSGHYYSYYDRHRGSMNYNSISHSVNGWRNRNRDIISDDWDRDKAGRTQRFKEYGKMEMDRTKYNSKNPGKQIEKTEYIQKERKNYPLLSADVAKNQLIQKESKTKPVQENITEPVKKPAVAVPDQYKTTGSERVTNKQPEQNIRQNNSNVRNTNINKQQQPVYPVPQQKTPAPVKQTENFNQIRNAQEYHQNTWNQIHPQSQPVQQPRQQYNTPPPRTQENRQVQQPIKQNTQPPANNKRK